MDNVSKMTKKIHQSCIKDTSFVRNIVEFGCAFKDSTNRWQKCTTLTNKVIADDCKFKVLSKGALPPVDAPKSRKWLQCQSGIPTTKLSEDFFVSV